MSVSIDAVKTGLNCCAGNRSCKECPWNEYRDGNTIAICTSELANAALMVVKDMEKAIENRDQIIETLEG